MLVKELPAQERPREKALRFGTEYLSSRELIALLLRTGYRGHSALSLADDLLAAAGGVKELGEMSVSEMARVKGISRVKAVEIRAAYELAKRSAENQIFAKDVILDPKDMISWLMRMFGNEKQERFITVFLDVKNHILGYKTIYIGGLSAVEVHSREIFREAISAASAKIILCHNHPSQDVTPSGDDIRTTEKLCRTGRMIGIPVIEHLIISGTQYYSFLEHRMIPPDE